MQVSLRAPLSASVIAWEAPHPAISVILGATFELTVEPALQARPIPLDQTVRGPVKPELWRTSDEVPWKGSPEVLLVGHAFASPASEAIPVRVRVGPVDKRFFAVASRASEHIPLSSAYLRTAERHGNPVRVAPVPPRAVGWDQRRLAPDFDFAAFNTAPQDQRLRTILPGMPLTLEGTLTGAGRYETRVPAFGPVAFLAPDADPSTWYPVPLTCDTLWIDADDGVAMMVWRGVCLAPPPGTALVVGGGDRAPTAAELAVAPLQAEASHRFAPEHGAATRRGGSLAVDLHALGDETAAFDGTPKHLFDVPLPQFDISDEETLSIDETTLQSRGHSADPARSERMRIAVEEARAVARETSSAPPSADPADDPDATLH